VGGVGIAELATTAAASLAVSEESFAGEAADSAHRAFARSAFNGTWELIDAPERTPEQDRQMLTLAFAARWHWSEVGTDENIAVSDWQVALVASLLGESRLATSYAAAAYERARASELPDWLRASTAEGMARACAVDGDRAGYDRYVTEARELVAALDDEEDRELITAQLATIPPP
jgi:hypothetical protein